MDQGAAARRVPPDALSGESPADQSPADQSPADQSPADQSPADQSPANQIPAESADSLAVREPDSEDLHPTADLTEGELTLPPLERWGHLEIREKVGHGAFGEVYRAWDPTLERETALKLLRPRLHGDNPDAAPWREARLLARLSHENVVTVFGVDHHDGRLGLWMEFIRGRTLESILRQQGPLGAREAALIALDVCRAVAAVHAAGLVHGDIKAQNVMRETGGRIVLMDFGVGQDSADEESTKPRHARGTPVYMAPELLQGEQATTRGDLYSVGVLLYHLVTGAFPVEGSTFSQVRQAHERGETQLLRDRRADLPESFVQLVERALASNARDRFATVGQMLQALSACIAADDTDRAPVPAGSAFRRRAILIVGAAAVLVALMFLLQLWDWSREPEQVLVADFENLSGEPLLDLAVRQLLTQALEQSRRFAVVPRARALETLELMRLPRTTPLDLAVAGQIGRRENIPTLITGTIAKERAGFEIVVRAADPSSDRTRAVVRQSVASKDDLPRAVGQLTAQLRSALGESSGQIERHSQPLARVTTGSFEALVAFSRALDLHGQGKLEESVPLLKAALEKDPEFTMARRQLAIVEFGLGRPDEALADVTRAYAVREKASERERHLIEAYYHWMRTDYARALESFQIVIELHPQDAATLYQQAQVEVSLREFSAAVDAARRAVVLSPGSVFHRAFLATTLAEANREEEALREVQSARAKPLSGPGLDWAEGLAWLGKGEMTRAAECFERLAKSGGVYESFARLYQAQLLILQGKLKEASSRLENEIWVHQVSGNRNNESRARAWLARLLVLEGDANKARTQIASFPSQSAAPWNLRTLRQGALIAGEAHERPLQDMVARQLEQAAVEYPSNFTQGIAAHVRGELLRTQGQLDDAGQHLERARALWGDAATLWSLAELWESRDDCRRALPLYHAVLDRKGSIVRWESSTTWVLAHLKAARCYRKLGNSVQATRYYDRFLQLWGAEAGHLAVVREAKAERQSL